MSAAVAAPLARFAEVRGETLALLAGLSQAQLDARPAPEKWSAGEIFDHLLLAEGIQRREISGLIHRALAGQPTTVYRSLAEFDVSVFFIPKSLLPFLSIPFSLAGLFVPAAARDVLARSRLLPAQNPTAAEPRRGRAQAELTSELTTSLAATRQLLNGQDHLPWERMRLVHPLLGSNNVPGMLRFLANHEQRHQAQIREALAAVATRLSRRQELNHVPSQ